VITGLESSFPKDEEISARERQALGEASTYLPSIAPSLSMFHRCSLIAEAEPALLMTSWWQNASSILLQSGVGACLLQHVTAQ